MQSYLPPSLVGEFSVIVKRLLSVILGLDPRTHGKGVPGREPINQD